MFSVFLHHQIYDTTLGSRDIAMWRFMWRSAGGAGIGYSSSWMRWWCGLSGSPTDLEVVVGEPDYDLVNLPQWLRFFTSLFFVSAVQTDSGHDMRWRGHNYSEIRLLVQLLIVGIIGEFSLSWQFVKDICYIISFSSCEWLFVLWCITK